MKHVFAASFGIAFAATTAFGQSLPVGETCTADSDCQTGICVQLKSEDGARKVCLYCSASNYDSYWYDVNNSCKGYASNVRSPNEVKDEMQRRASRRGEWSLPYLYGKLEVAQACLKARSTRENSCWKDKIDAGHRAQIETEQDIVNYTQGLIDDRKRYGAAYVVDEDTFNDLVEDEEQACGDLTRRHDDFVDDYVDVDAAAIVDCDPLEDLVDGLIDCREARAEILAVFKDGDPQQRRRELNDATIFLDDAKRVLAQKQSASLCD